MAESELIATSSTTIKWDFPGGPMVKNPPANIGGTGLIPGPGRFPDVEEQLSPYATTTEACLPRAYALQKEKSLQWKAHPPQWRVASLSPQLEKDAHSNEDPAQLKINKIFKKIPLDVWKWLVVGPWPWILKHCLTVNSPHRALYWTWIHLFKVCRLNQWKKYLGNEFKGSSRSFPGYLLLYNKSSWNLVT